MVNQVDQAAAILAGVPTAPRVDRPERPGPLEGVRIIVRHPVLRWLTVLVLASAFSSSLPEALAPALVGRDWLPCSLIGAQATVAVVTPPGRMGQVEATIVAGLITAGGAGVLLLGLLSNATSPGVAYLASGALLTVALLVSAPRLRRAEARTASSSA